MNITPTEFNCNREVIAEYYDGGLDDSTAAAVELHLNSCSGCNEYLNSLKMVSTSLEIMLDDVTRDVPKDFSSKVKTAAESNVSAVRDPLERSRATAIAAGFAVVFALLLVFNVAGIGSLSAAVAGKVLAFFSFVGHLLYAVVLTFASFAGTVCTKYLFSSSLTVVFVISAVLLSALIFSKHMRHFIRS